MTLSNDAASSDDKNEAFSWTPSRTMAECDAVLTQPGQTLETELAVVGGRVMRVYKHLWPVSRLRRGPCNAISWGHRSAGIYCRRLLRVIVLMWMGQKR